MGSEPVMTCLMRMQFTERRILSHQRSGMGINLNSEYKYKKYWDAIKVVPEEKKFFWNMKKHGHKDLCKFLNITGNPMCEKPGPLPKNGINVLKMEREQSWQNIIIWTPYFIFLNVVNYKLFWGLIRFLF